MKNKEYQKMLVMALTVSLTIGSMGVSVIPVRALESPCRTWQMTQGAAEKADDPKAEPVKDETVYVKLDGSGK